MTSAEGVGRQLLNYHTLILVDSVSPTKCIYILGPNVLSSSNNASFNQNWSVN